VKPRISFTAMKPYCAGYELLFRDRMPGQQTVAEAQSRAPIILLVATAGGAVAPTAAGASHGRGASWQPWRWRGRSGESAGCTCRRSSTGAASRSGSGRRGSRRSSFHFLA